MKIQNIYSYSGSLNNILDLVLFSSRDLVREWSIFMGIRGRKISYGAANFLDRHFIRAGKNNIAEYPQLPVLLTSLLVIKLCTLIRPTFPAGIQSRRLLGPSCFTGRTIFSYGAANFLDRHFIRGGQLFVDRKLDYSGPYSHKY